MSIRNLNIIPPLSGSRVILMNKDTRPHIYILILHFCGSENFFYKDCNPWGSDPTANAVKVGEQARHAVRDTARILFF